MDKGEEVIAILEEYNDKLEKAKIRREGAEEGMSIGFKEGKLQGIQEGTYKTMRAIFARMVKKGMTTKEIAKLLGYKEESILKVLGKPADGTKRRKNARAKPGERCFYVDPTKESPLKNRF